MATTPAFDAERLDYLTDTVERDIAAGEVLLGWRFFAELDADSLRSWRAQDLEQWRSRLSPQAWQRRFGIGDDQPYSSVEQLLACTDWNDLITTVIPGLRP